MVMGIKRVKIPPGVYCDGCVSPVEVEETKVKDGLDKSFKKVVKEINVPGFRKGKMRCILV